MSDLRIRKQGRAGRITLARPKALNALTYQMVLDIEAALDTWAGDDTVALVIIDAEGDKAFCAGGDIKQMYATAKAGDFAYGRQYWRDEYRLNAKIARYPKPYIAFLQGHTMGGGVGVSCHGSHRIVQHGSLISLPECKIGLVPDVGGTLLLARAPGHFGEYLAMTGESMNAENALFAGFATHYVPADGWEDLKHSLCETGRIDPIEAAAQPSPNPQYGWFERIQAAIDQVFSAPDVSHVLEWLEGSELDDETTGGIGDGSPLSVCCALELVRRARANPTVENALKNEFRFVYRSASEGDFIEGIRARVIEKNTPPDWHHLNPEDVTKAEVETMLAPLGSEELDLGEKP